MTHFLTRLAERTLGTVQAARPVIAPTFAPGPHLAASEPPMFVLEEVTESVDTGQKASQPHAPNVPQPAAFINYASQQPTISPGQPITEISDTEAQPRVSRHVPLRQEVSSAPSPGIETPRKESITATHVPAEETIPSPSPTSSSLLPIETRSASIPTVQPTREAIPLVGAIDRMPTITTQLDNAAYVSSDSMPLNAPTFRLETHAQRLVSHFVEQKRAASAPPDLPVPLQGEPARRETGPEYVSNQPYQPATLLPQSVIHEVTEMRASPDLTAQQQGKHPIDASVQQISTHSHQMDERDVPSVGNLTLVPARNDTQVTPQQQVTEQSPVYKQLERDQVADAIRVTDAINRVPTSSREVSQRIVENQIPETGETPSEIPTIRVTIGRIDVRAVTPAAPPRSKPTRSGPKVSLDDYNRQSKGGQ